MSVLQNNIFLMVYNVLAPRERRLLFILFIFFFFVSLVELTGVAAVFLYIKMVIGNQPLLENAYIRELYYFLGAENKTEFFIATGMLLLLLFFVKTLTSALSTWVIPQFSFFCFRNISNRLLAVYLNKKYSFFLGYHTSNAKRHIVDDAFRVAYEAILPAIVFVSELFVFAFIIILLFVIMPDITLFATALMLLTVLGYMMVTRKVRQDIGANRVMFNRKRHKIINELFGIVKEIKISSVAQHYFYNEFCKANYTFTKAAANGVFLQSIFRVIVEFIVIVVMLAVIIYTLHKGGEITAIIPVIALYGIAALRLLPSVAKLVGSYTSFNIGKAILKGMYPLLLNYNPADLNPAKEKNKLTFNKAIKFRHVSYRYSGSDRNALTNVSLTIPKGEVTAIVGKSGAGKSTFINLLAGLLESTKGGVYVDNVRLTPKNTKNWQEMIGYVPQHFTLLDATITENIALGMLPKDVDMRRIKEVCEIACIKDFIEKELPNAYDTMLGERGSRLSGGQAQRLSIARALYTKPSVLILDEASSALDALTEKEFKKSLSALKGKITTVIISHKPSMIKGVENCYFLDSGIIKRM